MTGKLFCSIGVLRGRVRANRQLFNLLRIHLLEIDVAHLRLDQMMMPVRVEAHNVRFALEFRVVEQNAHMLAGPKFFAAAGNNPQLVSPAANPAFNMSNVLALFELELLVLQAFLTDGSKVLEGLASRVREIVLIEHFDASDTIIKVNADLTDLRDAYFLVQVNHLLHVFMVDFGIVTSFDLGLLNAFIPGRSVWVQKLQLQFIQLFYLHQYNER